MEIRFTKKENGQGMLHCDRPDGTATWMRLTPFFVLHDLCHYVVETTLGFHHAFYGMLESGTDIRDFELPRDQRSFSLTPEALQAEQLVNLLVIEYSQGRIHQFNEELDAVNTLNENRQPAVKLDPEQLEMIRRQFLELTEKWKSLPVNESLTLNFTI